MWAIDGAGYALGILLATKLAIRWLKGYLPPRWEIAENHPSSAEEPSPRENHARHESALLLPAR